MVGSIDVLGTMKSLSEFNTLILLAGCLSSVSSSMPTIWQILVALFAKYLTVDPAGKMSLWAVGYCSTFQVLSLSAITL